MATFQQRKDPLRLMWRRFAAVVLLCVLAIAVRGVWGVYQKEKDSERLRTEANASLIDLQKRQVELQANISNLKSEQGIEAELRERYDLARAGEGVVVIVEPQKAPAPQQQTTLQRFKSFFSW